VPDLVAELSGRWSLSLGPPFDGAEVSAGWVAPATRADGTASVLKLGMPHFEAEHELAGLRFWAGDPTVRLLEADDALNAMLLERCEPGTVLRNRPEPEQDVVIAGLLRRMWRVPPEPHPFRPLAETTARWSEEARAASARWADAGLVRAAMSLFEELPRTAAAGVLLATDLHAGNVLRARREPWLVIDPKPFVGDPAYDATQHILNCERLQTRPLTLIRRVAGLLDVDAERVRLWTFARLAIENCDSATPDSATHLPLARSLAP
jgi:streptomycin 6-kinase